MRMPAVGLPRPSISALTRSAASGVTAITCGRGRRGRGAAGVATAAGWGASVVVVGVLMNSAPNSILACGGVLRRLDAFVLLRSPILGGLRAIVGNRRLDRVL